MTEDKGKRYGADAIIDSLVNHDVKYVFGVLVLRLIGYLKDWNIQQMKKHLN